MVRALKWKIVQWINSQLQINTFPHFQSIQTLKEFVTRLVKGNKNWLISLVTPPITACNTLWRKAIIVELDKLCSRHINIGRSSIWLQHQQKLHINKINSTVFPFPEPSKQNWSVGQIHLISSQWQVTSHYHYISGVWESGAKRVTNRELVQWPEQQSW